MHVEMTGGGKPGNPKTGFPPFLSALEIAMRFPHSHTPGGCGYTQLGTKNASNKLFPMSLDKSVTYVPGATYHGLLI
jgi:hypothetical protein